MWSFAYALILSALAVPATTASRKTDAAPIFYCDFGDKWDVNFDHWPDRWTRQTGAKLPHYVEVALEKEPTARGERCLTIHANGGDVRCQSPPIGVTGKFGYVAEVNLGMKGIRYGRARVVLEFCDNDLVVLQSATSQWIRGTTGWKTLKIGPVNPEHADVRYARFALEFEGGKRADLSGTASLDDVWLARLPKMTVRTNSPYNVYTNPGDVEISCELSGIREQNPYIHFELFDAGNARLSKNALQVEGLLITENVRKASDFLGHVSTPAASYMGRTVWSPKIEEYGFYRVRVSMKTDNGILNQHLVNIVVAPPLKHPAEGEFGWSLANDAAPLGFAELGELLPRVALNWVKLPVWCSAKETNAVEELVIFTEQLAAKDIETVAVIARPPEEQLDRVPIADSLSNDPSMWMPSLDPVLTRLSLRVRWWQLGNDYDASFTGLPHLGKEIAKLRSKLFRFGQDIKLGIGWNWLLSQSDEQVTTWEFQQYTAEPALTGAELGEYLRLPRKTALNRWVLIEPLARSQYDLETRIVDLVEQMLAAKINDADAAFIARPFNDEHGLMTSHGTPSALLLPWRTTASLLSGAEYLGRMHLPKGSENRLFQTPQGDVVMVVWNERPVKEIIHLGEDIYELDVWGRQGVPRRQEHRQIIEVDSLPKFIRGLNPAIARWRLSVKLMESHVPSVFGKTHDNALSFRNYFKQGAGGSFSLAASEGWQVGPPKVDFKLAAGGNNRGRFDITLPFDANSGEAPIRIDFNFSADTDYRFSVYRRLNVGDGRVQLDVQTRLDAEGHLIVEQRMTNQAGDLPDFKCLLYAPGHRRQRTHVFRLSGAGDVQTYRLKHGVKLLGKEIWLRAEEVNGSRVLNRRFVAEQ